MLLEGRVGWPCSMWFTLRGNYSSLFTCELISLGPQPGEHLLKSKSLNPAWGCFICVNTPFVLVTDTQSQVF